jgi:hypothetical protein
MIAANPAAPGIMESVRQYVEAGRVAIQLANAIRRSGYPALAHIDGNYRVIAPRVARDAGLGEIGRMGMLMTPRYGPRACIVIPPGLARNRQLESGAVGSGRPCSLAKAANLFLDFTTRAGQRGL